MSAADRKRTDWRKRAAGWLELPPDLVLDLPKITLTGSLQISVENHQGLLLYREDEIVIRAGNRLRIRIRGEDLHLGVVYDDEITVVGQIASIHLQ